MNPNEPTLAARLDRLEELVERVSREHTSLLSRAIEPVAELETLKLSSEFLTERISELNAAVTRLGSSGSDEEFEESVSAAISALADALRQVITSVSRVAANGELLAKVVGEKLEALGFTPARENTP